MAASRAATRMRAWGNAGPQGARAVRGPTGTPRRARMSATPPTVQGTASSQKLGAALAAITLAIVVVVALIGLRATAAQKSAAAPAQAPVPAFERGSATDPAKIAAPAFSVAGDLHGSVTGAIVAAPVQEAPNGGRGTRMAR